MQRLSGWELRRRAGQQDVPVSGKQFASYVSWGLLPERDGGGWAEPDIGRLVRIRKLGESVRPLHRRVILLRDLDFPTPPDRLRQAMVDTVPSIAAALKKMRALYRAIQVLHGETTPADAARLSVPHDWRPPERGRWLRSLRWPTDEAFEAIAGSVYSEAHALTRNPRVASSGLLADIPFEELVVLLMTRQLTVGELLARSEPRPTEHKPRA